MLAVSFPIHNICFSSDVVLEQWRKYLMSRLVKSAKCFSSTLVQGQRTAGHPDALFFKDFLDCPKHGRQDETAGVWGQLVDAEVVAADVDLEILGEVHKKNVAQKLRIVERGNVVGQAVGSSILSPDNLPPVLGEEAGDGGAKAAEGKAAEGNAATAEPDHQWGRVGRCGDVAVELLVRNGKVYTLSHCRGLDGRRLPRGAVGLW